MTQPKPETDLDEAVRQEALRRHAAGRRGCQLIYVSTDGQTLYLLAPGDGPDPHQMPKAERAVALALMEVAVELLSSAV